MNSKQNSDNKSHVSPNPNAPDEEGMRKLQKEAAGKTEYQGANKFDKQISEVSHMNTENMPVLNDDQNKPSY